jgi:hypothetical protein
MHLIRSTLIPPEDQRRPSRGAPQSLRTSALRSPEERPSNIKSEGKPQNSWEPCTFTLCHRFMLSLSFFNSCCSEEGVILTWSCFYLTKSVAQKPRGSSLYSQEPVTSPYPEPTGSTVHPLPASVPNLRSILIPSSHLRLGSSKWSLSFGLSHQNLVHFSLLPHACHMHRPPHSPWFDLPNNGDEYKLWSSLLCNFLHFLLLLSVKNKE